MGSDNEMTDPDLIYTPHMHVHVTPPPHAGNGYTLAEEGPTPQ